MAINDPLGGVIMGFFTLVSGISELGDQLGTSNKVGSCTNVSSRYESVSSTLANRESETNYSTFCCQYYLYLAEERRKHGSLILIR